MDNFKLNILIVEDNLSFALELEMLLEELNYAVIGQVDNSADALDLIYSKKPDLILMDVNIKGSLTGIEIGQNLTHLNIPILYITSLNERKYYDMAKQSNMIGYLIKPVDKITLQSTIEIAVQNAHNPSKLSKSNTAKQHHFINNGSFFFKKKGIYYKVNIADIAFIKSDRNYCESYITNGEVFTNRMPLSEILVLLPQDQFMQVHRQYIIQVSHIEAINFQDSILRIQQNSIPVSRTKRKELEEMIKRFS